MQRTESNSHSSANGEPPSIGAVVDGVTAASDRRRSAGGQTPAESIFQAKNLGRRDPRSGAWLIRDVSLSVNRGDRVAVLGPTGAGKTVLLRSLALLDKLDAGVIHWRSREVRGQAVPDYRTHVIYLHQRPALVEGSVEDNLRHPYAFAAHKGKRFDPNRIRELLERLGRNESFLEKSNRDLSGGESQIVALLRAVQLDPEVLLLDEPTASLDPDTARALENLINGWYEAGFGNRAFVWVSHDLEQAERISSRKLRMQSGHLVAE
jgi:putative ABC transport system ATP-binding protein